MQTIGTIDASEVEEGDFLTGLANGYVVEVETGNGYLSYPSTGSGYAAAMPEDTILITFHDEQGNENYLLAAPSSRLDVRR